jgi:hypothetical protein
MIVASNPCGLTLSQHAGQRRRAEVGAAATGSTPACLFPLVVGQLPTPVPSYRITKISPCGCGASV